MHNQPREPQPYEDCQAKSIQEFDRERYTKHAKLEALPIWSNTEPTMYGRFKQTGPENLEPYQRQGCKT